jgi:acetolactate synthase regulatory subunit
MKQNFECEIAQTEGSLIRVLGVIERRGYKLLEMRVKPASQDTYLLSFSIASDRDPAILIKQLERLFDVHDVFLSTAGAARSEHCAEAMPPPSFQASWIAG